MNFSTTRFVHALRNDLLSQSKRIVIATLAFLGVALLIVVTNVEEQSEDPNLFGMLFSVLLVGGGLLFTSWSWSDMHHPLGRFHYLMLPYSNLERFISRYLLTAPLYYLFAAVVFTLFQPLVNAVTGFFLNATTPTVSLTSTTALIGTWLFFGLQPLAFAGAIRFRNFALPRTALAGFVAYLALALVAVIAARIIYWDYFDALFHSIAPIHMGLMDLITPETGHVIAAVGITAACLWVLYLAWLMLNDHEVQDGL